MEDNQIPLFYEDIYDAINQDIATSGNRRKEIASLLYPGRKIETAISLLSRALSSENTDVHLSVEQLFTIMQHTGGSHVLNYMCDMSRCERPRKKERRSIERTINDGLASMQKQMTAFMRLAEQLKDLPTEEVSHG